MDDERSICETVSWMLESEGFEVTSTMDFKKAEEIIRKKDFDVYLIDLVLPGGSGINLIKQIRVLGRKGSIILITGYTNIPSLVDSIRLDTYDYVKKPLKKADLLEIINYAVKLKRKVKNDSQFKNQLVWIVEKK